MGQIVLHMVQDFFRQKTCINLTQNMTPFKIAVFFFEERTAKTLITDLHLRFIGPFKSASFTNSLSRKQ